VSLAVRDPDGPEPRWRDLVHRRVWPVLLGALAMLGNAAGFAGYAVSIGRPLWIGFAIGPLLVGGFLLVETDERARRIAAGVSDR